LGRAHAHGWTLDNTSDLARVFRVAGTVNRKDRAHPAPVEILVYEEGRRYRPEDFEPHLVCEPPPLRTTPNGHVPPSAVKSTVRLEDEDLLRRALAARDGARFAQLWAGDITDNGNDHSAADIAFCNLLAFWTGGNVAQMDGFFRRSGLWRPKWDEVHYAGGETYGEHTIAESIARTECFYTAGPGGHGGDDQPTDNTAEEVGNTSVASWRGAVWRRRGSRRCTRCSGGCSPTES